MTPHYVRFARSLALLGGLGALTTGCPETTTPDDASSGGADAVASSHDAHVSPTDDAHVDPTTDAYVHPTNDAYAVADDAFNICDTCSCFGPGGDGAVDAGVTDCTTLAGAEVCCAAVGPLAPPDLVV